MRASSHPLPIPLLLFLSAHLPTTAAIENTNYFKFPAKNDEVGTYIPNDTLKLQWVASTSPNVITVLCKDSEGGYTNVSSTPPTLPSTGSHTINLLPNWSLPCYFSLSATNNPKNTGFASGFIDSSPLTRPASTFTSSPTSTPLPDASLCAFAVPTADISSTSSNTNTNTAAARNEPISAPSANNTTCTETTGFSANISMSNRTSIGVGIVVGVSASALIAGIWFWIAKYTAQRREKARAREEERSRRMMEGYKSKAEGERSEFASVVGGIGQGFKRGGGYVAVGDVEGQRERESQGRVQLSRHSERRIPVRTLVQRDSLRGRAPLEMEAGRGPYEMLSESRLKR